MILNDVTITFIEGEDTTVDNVKYMDFDENTLTLNCIHDLNIEVPMEDIDTITIERKIPDVWKYEDTDSLRSVDNG